MALPVFNYAAIQPQGNPAMRGLLPAIQQGLQLKYGPKMMASDLERQQLANALAKVNLEYAPQMTQAELAYRQAQTPHLNAATNFLNEQGKYYGPDVLSQMALRDAQTSQIGQETKFSPLRYAIDYSNSLRSSERFGNSYQMRAWLMSLSPPARAQWIAENSEDYNRMLVDIANAGKKDGSDILRSMGDKYFPQELTLSPDEQAKLQQAGIAQAISTDSNSPQIVNAMPLPITKQMTSMAQMFNAPNQESQNKFKLANQMAANNALTTNYSRKQGEAAAKLDNWLKEAQPQYSKAMQNISQYAGILGKGKKGLDMLKKENPEAYRDYQWFTNTFRTNIDALITQMEGTSITNDQQNAYKKMLSDSIDNLTTDPASAIDQMNRLWQTLGDISEQRAEIAQPLYKNTYKDAYNYEGIPNPYIAPDVPAGIAKDFAQTPAGNNISDHDLAFTAQKYGMTVDKLKQKLGLK